MFHCPCRRFKLLALLVGYPVHFGIQLIMGEERLEKIETYVGKRLPLTLVYGHGKANDYENRFLWWETLWNPTGSWSLRKSTRYGLYLYQKQVMPRYFIPESTNHHTRSIAHTSRLINIPEKHDRQPTFNLTHVSTTITYYHV